MAWNKDGIISLLLEAGEVATRLRRNIGWEFKADRSLVTAADKEIEDLFTARLENPDAGTYLIGEETVAEKGEDYLREALREEAYIVDPIDGTVPYVFQLPNWGISVGRTDELGSAAVEDRFHVKHLHATALHLLGLDPNHLTYFYGGLDQKLVGVEGAEPIPQVLA